MIEKENRRRFQFSLQSLMVLVALTAALLSSAVVIRQNLWSDNPTPVGEELTLRPGDLCTIVFRRETLGLDHAYLRPTTVNGIGNFIQGRFVAMNEEWIAIQDFGSGKEQHWIPREHVLFLKVVPKE